VTKIPDRDNFREEGFILAHSFRGFSPWSLGPRHLGRKSWQQEYMEEDTLHIMVDRKQKARTGLGIMYKLQRHTPETSFLQPHPTS
jgi:hypothetical protein